MVGAMFLLAVMVILYKDPRKLWWLAALLAAIGTGLLILAPSAFAHTGGSTWEHLARPTV
jgi:hypothetical protein